jgi:hypothetical protein
VPDLTPRLPVNPRFRKALPRRRYCATILDGDADLFSNAKPDHPTADKKYKALDGSFLRAMPGKERIIVFLNPRNAYWFKHSIRRHLL